VEQIAACTAERDESRYYLSDSHMKNKWSGQRFWTSIMVWIF